MEQTGLMKMVHDAARHAAARQTHISRNIANADTPGYRAADLPAFADTLDTLGQPMRATRPGHLHGATAASAASVSPVERTSESSPNGNNVSIEHEMMQSTEAQAQHETALSIYATAREILATSLGRGR